MYYFMCLQNGRTGKPRPGESGKYVICSYAFRSSSGSNCEGSADWVLEETISPSIYVSTETGARYSLNPSASAQNRHVLPFGRSNRLRSWGRGGGGRGERGRGGAPPVLPVATWTFHDASLRHMQFLDVRLPSNFTFCLPGNEIYRNRVTQYWKEATQTPSYLRTLRHFLAVVG